MKKIAISILSIFIIAAFSGCTGPNTVTTPSGDVKVESVGNGPDWCKAGTKVTSATQGGQGSFEIKGMTKYEGKDVCQSEYKYNEGSITQYYTENGKYVVMIYKDSTGKEINKVVSDNP